MEHDAELLIKPYFNSEKLVEIDLSKKYPDGMPIVNSPADGFYTALLRPKSLESFVTAMFWFDKMAAETTIGIGHLIIPQVPGSRQDRQNEEGDQLFTLRSVARMINERKFAKVTVLDPHSDVTPALIDRCNVIPSVRCVQSITLGTCAVVAPDGGAEKRAMKVAQKLNVPLIHAWKKRDIATGKLSGFGMEPTDGLRGRLLLVDDMCDGGGTFLGLADVIAERGFQADLFVTHGIFSQGTEKLLQKFKKVFTTDSILGNKPGVDVNNICISLLKGTYY